VTAATETWRDWSIALRDDSSRSFSDLLMVLVASSLAEVMLRATSVELPSMVCENPCARVSIERKASIVTRSTSEVSWLVLPPIASTSAPRLLSIASDRRSVCCCT
jgi:hypothetical protein